MLSHYLIKQTREMSSFSLSALKKKFPKEKQQIDKFYFLGLIEPVSMEFPDIVRAHIHGE